MTLILPKGTKSRGGGIHDWEGDPNRLVVGIEEERFVLQDDGATPTVDQIKNLFEDLCSHGYEVRRIDEDGRPLALGAEFDSGYLSIKPDAYTHIIEIALPPLAQGDAISQLLSSVWGAISSNAAKVELNVLAHTSFLPHPPQPLRFSPTYTRADWMQNRPVPQTRLGIENRVFNALIASTQIHLNIAERGFPLLPFLYQYEYFIPILFSNCASNESSYHCIRPLVWTDSFDSSYTAVGIPNPVPTNPAEYDRWLHSCRDFKRDYSLIAPRATGSFEFRSACNQPNSQRTLELIAFRIGILLAAQETPLEVGGNQLNALFREACTSGWVKDPLLAQHFEILKRQERKIPEQWKDLYHASLLRLESSLSKANQ